MADITQLLTQYAEGPGRLRAAVAGMTDEQLDARPVAGMWSTRQVICHLADFEPIYADRMKRVIAEDEPTFFGGDPDVFAARLAYDARNVEQELLLIEVVRGQMLRILGTLATEDFARLGRHSVDGPLPLTTLLERITNHIPHHIRFIETKRQALAAAD